MLTEGSTYALQTMWNNLEHQGRRGKEWNELGVAAMVLDGGVEEGVLKGSKTHTPFT